MSKVEKENFVSSIHVYRAIHRMTQQELAEKIGVSRQTILQLEKNRYNPSLLLAFRIAKFFHVRIEDIFVVKES
ncbi:helix-turn-helix transcriptional regulator [Enterococcus faecalis]|nr:helix-turn-helix transcriptional regulator [Enterococcus faecalis]EGO9216836.1 transcriptional regulator [Enterococcus faecalis]EKE3415649.1 helix-turn-helix transcriptional regulator [Enterococcus faecalis]EKJ5027091.1 helix-turn-helix transcriptional regulator [Enterococcus faecalis]EMD7413256.1 helix-turn-helix transcriptional regulator [Enterococcus faecalis]